MGIGGLRITVTRTCLTWDSSRREWVGEEAGAYWPRADSFCSGIISYCSLSGLIAPIEPMASEQSTALFGSVVNCNNTNNVSV